jgi:tetratricopeptide (TPR) repeat protein
MAASNFMRYTVVFAVFILFPISNPQAAEPCEPVVGKLVSVEGRVELQRSGASTWSTAQLQDTLCQGDTVRAGERSRAAVALLNEAVLRIDQSSALRLVNLTANEEERSLLSLIRGAFQSFSRKPRRFEVSTPYLNGSVEGTEFLVRVEDDRTSLTVLEGQVVASNAQGTVSVGQGESATAEAGKAPTLRTLVRPRDAVQWSLYYPPVLAVLGGRVGRVPPNTPPALREAISLAGRGNSPAAFAALDAIPEAERDASFHLYRAALSLSVGRVNEAGTDIDKALRQDPNAGLGYSLRAIIKVVQNERTQALEDAERGVALSNTAAAKIALSYAQQAEFRIEAARETLQAAVQQHPEDPLAWARLAELWLMQGERARAREAADQAVALAPNLQRTQLVRGFAALAEFRSSDAKIAFAKAIRLDSADPLAHLGLGLAKISQGSLAEGRAGMEVAVSLDSNNALLRAYLGKAYFEEKRYPLDSEQYDIAKTLDPLDPTAYLYNGILNQTINRPVEAVRDLERSIELNDNRAVYRSRLLLDKDRAARGTSLARAYRDLGFGQLAINRSTESLALDPSNFSAHRFLSDTYLGKQRLEISRVSELLQAQLMQDINIYPIQPSVAATNLNIITIGGPATPGFNEFTPLFERNKAQLNVSGFGGNNETYGGEGVVSAVYDRFSLSLGGFSYDTDGWRPNNDVDQKIFNGYGQWAITNELNVQAEYRYQDSETGDLEFRFDPDDFIDDRKVDTDRNSIRLGLRYSPTTASNFIFSYIYNDRDEERSESQPFDPVTTLFFDSDLETDGSLIEGQYIHQADSFNLVLGGGYSNPDTTGTDSFEVVIDGLGPVVSFEEDVDRDIEQPRGYAYSNIALWDVFTGTVGASYDDYEDEPVDNTSFNPKLGVRWDINNANQFRAAVFKVLKPSLVNNRTIEPTQVAGFNQFFDDEAGTESWRYGVAFDSRPLPGLSWGAELTWRDKDVPVVTFTEAGTEETGEIDQDEQLHRVYAYWTPTERLAVTGEVIYDKFEEDSARDDDFRPVPAEVTTVSAPLGITYFHPSGFFAGVLGTYVDQEVERSDNSVFAQGDDRFFLVDLTVSYRFPKRRGMASFGVKNLFDKDFKYQDDSYREFSEDASIGPYFPDRFVMARLTLSF